ncbi:CCA tRNA nucleotidyltransferase [Ponticoccus alexandrii]|uniref:CCA tRNA nucleotidyltransferase n=1 Tax=Ponticoccus alexandrii TaxID=1943633 RepID=A0ABX7FDR3_9RHOB|nr:CCA tRNA nucleotidyltransferase [Ponticoccus alexandrii]ETA52975.1 poly(A) polymerase [Rhodobacteraceae bacterium PD-2]QRF68261.1 CCA tRNA nucleotidyltransferase [Ponticoccus alexandrii]
MTTVTGDWLTAPGTQAVMGMLEDAGYQAHAVGGCVRNALLGEPVADVDISTDARPETVIALAEAAGLKPVPTGIDHGTITVVAKGEPFEVTTYRADVETDGRRAVVRFADTMAEDAVRRDFTMNALYADRRGAVVDPLGGLPDLRARHLRFIEDAAQRIREDYLRTLRFFRFHAWYGDPAQGMDAEALSAIADNLDGLDRLSAERVGAELLKLLAAPDPVQAVAVMDRTGVLPRILPGASPRALGPLLMAEAALALAPEPLRRLASTGFADGAALRLSKPDQKRLALLRDLVEGTEALPEVAYRHGTETAKDTAALRAAMLEQPVDPDALPELAKAANARFPVTAQDLMPALTGKALGDRLRALESQWIASGFTLSREDLLKARPEA